MPDQEAPAAVEAEEQAQQAEEAAEAAEAKVDEEAEAEAQKVLDAAEERESKKSDPSKSDEAAIPPDAKDDEEPETPADETPAGGSEEPPKEEEKPEDAEVTDAGAEDEHLFGAATQLFGEDAAKALRESGGLESAVGGSIAAIQADGQRAIEANRAEAEAAAKPPESKPEPKPKPKPQEAAADAEEAEPPTFDPDVFGDEGAAALTSLSQQMTGLAQKVTAAEERQAKADASATEETNAQAVADWTADYDGAVAALKQPDLFGEGGIEEIEKGSDSFTHRGQLEDAVITLGAGYQARGLKPPPVPELVRMAFLGSDLGKGAVAKAKEAGSDEALEKVRKGRLVGIGRTAAKHRTAKPATDEPMSDERLEAEAIAEANKILEDKGIVLSP